MTSTLLAWDTDQMPRRPPHGQGPDEWAAWRIGYERERRGWSQGELARRVTAAGAPMQQQAIWKIENGTPPRRISLSEAIAFSEVFCIEDVTELGQPPEEIANSILWQIKDSFRDWRGYAETLVTQLRDIRELHHADPEAWPEILKILRGWLDEIDTEVANVRSWLASEDSVVRGAEEIERSEREAEEDRRARVEDRAKARAEAERERRAELEKISAWLDKLQPGTAEHLAAAMHQEDAPIGQADGVNGTQQPVVAAIVTSRRGVLITARRDGRPPWGFVTGEVEPGEQPEDAAVREVKEETGLEVRFTEVIGERDHPQTGRHLIYMAARPVRGTKVFVGDEAELSEVRWASVAEAEELLPGMFGPVRDYLHRAGT